MFGPISPQTLTGNETKLVTIDTTQGNSAQAVRDRMLTASCYWIYLTIAISSVAKRQCLFQLFFFAVRERYSRRNSNRSQRDHFEGPQEARH